MASRSERIKLLAQAIGADIKSILAKTNLLKTAAYKDVGTTAGTIPQYVGVNGVGGLGYGGLVTNLPASTNLDDLRYITANYSGVFKPIGFPAGEAFIGSYSLSVIAGDSGVKQVLSAVFSAYPDVKFKTFERFRLSKWSDWVLSVGDSGGIKHEIIPTGSSLNALPKINGTYFGKKSSTIPTAGMPAELSAYIYDFDFFLETMISPDTYAYVQTLYAVLYDPSQTYNNVIYTRLARYGTFTEWVRVSGFVAGVDVGGDVVGDDLIVNSIKAGATSPKIAYELIRLDMTYSNFGYMPDGITAKTGSADNKGYAHISSTINEVDVISMSVKVVGKLNKLFGSDSLYNIPNKNTLSGVYYDANVDTKGNSVLIFVRSDAHTQELGLPDHNSGETLLTDGGYIELFITYKVD